MAQGKPVGTMFASIDLDATKLEKGLEKTYKTLVDGTIKVEDSYRSLGIKSDAVYEQMRKNATAAVDFIKNKTLSSKEEIVRAEQAAADKIKQINAQQYGSHVSMLDSMKKNWVAVSAAGIAAWMAVGKAMEYATLGAKAEQAKESFRIVSEASGINASKLIADLKRVSAGTIEESDIMQKAVSGIAKGLSADQLVGIMQAARVSARVAGEDVLTAYEGITDAIANQLPKSLKKYGLVTMEEMALVKKALAAGVEDVNLYTMAMANATIQQARMGEMATNTAERLQQSHARIKELKETIGEFAIALGQRLLGAFYGFAGAVTNIAAGIAYIVRDMETYNAMVASGNDLMQKGAAIAGVKTAAEQAAAAAGVAGQKAQVEAALAAKKAEKERLETAIYAATIGKKIEEDTRKAIAEIEGVGKSNYEKEMARINSQAAEYKKKGAAQIDVAKWVAAETTLAFKKQGEEILKMEQEIADAVDKIRETQMKGKLDDIRDRLAQQEKFYSDQERALKEYDKIVTKARDWDISENQRAINEIQSSEASSINALKAMYEAGYFGEGIEALQKLFEGIDAARTASGIAEEARLQKQMAAEVNLYAQLTDFAGTYYEKKLALIEKERVANAILYGEKAAQAKAELDIRTAAATRWEMEHAGINSIISDTQKMFDAAASGFKRESSEYRALMKLKEIAYAAEMGMNVAKAASALSVAMAQNAANASVATTGAAASVAAQGSVPVAGFALAAAMAAFMASILAASGIAWGGGSGGGSAPVLPPSTVLGAEAGTGSESISKSWEKLMDIDTLQYRELAGIHNSMKELNQNITGLVTSIVRTGGVGSFNAGSPSQGFGNTATSYVGNYFEGEFNTMTLGLLKGWGDKVGDTISGWLGFGSKSFTGTGGGIQVGGYGTGSLDDARFTRVTQSVNDFLNGVEVAASKYTDIMVTGSKGDTWMNVAFEALNIDTTRLITLVYKGLSENLVAVAKMFGTDMEKAKGYIFESFKLDLSKYTTGEEINKALSDYFSKVADNAATAIFGEFVLSYQKLSEGPFQTAIRLATDMTIVMETLSATGQTFAGTIPQIIAFSESLIKLAGGLDKLQEASATYYDKFFTDEEKQTRLQAQLSSGLGSLGYALPGERSGYRALVEGLDLTTEAGKEAYVALLKWSAAADEYYSVVEDAAGGTDKLTESLRNQAETITKWLADLNKSALAPVTSARAYEQEYERMKVAAYGPGATEADTSAFLAEASTYLKFSRAYGGDYADIYAQVTGDVKALGDMKTYEANQLDAIREADLAAREASRIAQEQANELARLIAGIPPGQTARTMGSGGLAGGVVVAGEMGPEWVVPTYEPQRSRFLESAPPQFWENLRGAGVVQPGGGGDITVRVPVYLDGKVVADVVAKNIPRNGNLADAIRRIN